MRVLGIETSCDETAAAVYDGDAGLLTHELHSQVALHAAYGGVVPELASRDHLRKLLPLLEKSVEESGGAGRHRWHRLHRGPGLVGALLVGAAVARSLAYAWNVPCIGVHHMEGHLLAPLLEPEPPRFPFVALLVSGGHTLLARVEGVGRYELLGEFARRRRGRGLRQDRQAARAWAIPAARSWRSWPSRAGPRLQVSRGRCSTGPASISRSAG